MPDAEREPQTEKDLHFHKYFQCFIQSFKILCFKWKKTYIIKNEREEKRERKEREKTKREVASWSLDVTQAVTLIKTYDIFSIHACSSEIIYMPKLYTYKAPLMYNLHLKH